ncbi:MAG: hypothetical protein KGI54_10655 [Pseudomonadota bacterium]|nr:hypothetical protein [Pseudomonadota bacterium]
MLVSKTLETSKGTVKFEGELEPAELDLVIKLGLNLLLMQGALPLTDSNVPYVPNNVQ